MCIYQNMPPMSLALVGASRWQQGLCFGGCYGCGAFEGSEPFRERGMVSFFREFWKTHRNHIQLIDFLLDSIVRYDLGCPPCMISPSMQYMFYIDRYWILMYLMCWSWCRMHGNTVIDGPLIGMSQCGWMEKLIRWINWWIDRQTVRSIDIILRSEM